MSPTYRQFPDRWGSDSLTSFLDAAIGNIATTSERNDREYPWIARVNEAFERAISAPFNAELIIEAALLMRSHSSFRAGTTLAMAGMNSDTFVQARGCLENALYALHMWRNPDLHEVWLKRHEDEGAFKASKSRFRIPVTLNTLKAEAPRLHETAQKLYDRTIDFGAHPNERSVTSGLSIKDVEGGKKMEQEKLSGGTLQQQHSMKTTAQAGLSALYIFRLVFKERFDLLHVTDKLDALSREL